MLLFFRSTLKQSGLLLQFFNPVDKNHAHLQEFVIDKVPVQGKDFKLI